MTSNQRLLVCSTLYFHCKFGTNANCGDQIVKNPPSICINPRENYCKDGIIENTKYQVSQTKIRLKSFLIILLYGTVQDQEPI